MVYYFKNGCSLLEVHLRRRFFHYLFEGLYFYDSYLVNDSFLIRFTFCYFLLFDAQNSGFKSGLGQTAKAIFSEIFFFHITCRIIEIHKNNFIFWWFSDRGPYFFSPITLRFCTRNPNIFRENPFFLNMFQLNVMKKNKKGKPFVGFPSQKLWIIEKKIVYLYPKIIKKN